MIVAMGRGAAFPSISRRQIEELPMPCPPLREQNRIVQRVDELMAVCDRLEAAQAERERRRDRVVAASLQRLNQPTDDAKRFRRDAAYHLHHLARSTTRMKDIERLRNTILNLAVRGELVEVSTSARRPEALRESARLQNGYAFKSEWFVKTGIRLLRNVNVGHGDVRWNDSVYLTEDRAREFTRFQVSEGDVVLSLDRPFIATGTKVARVKGQDIPCLLLQRVGRFELNVDRITPQYLFLWLLSPEFANQIDPGRSNGVPHVSSKDVESAKIFVPTLSDQQRIVAIVEKLMAVCDRLEAQLAGN